MFCFVSKAGVGVANSVARRADTCRPCTTQATTALM